MKTNKNVYQKGKGETGEEWDKVARLLQIYLNLIILTPQLYKCFTWW